MAGFGQNSIETAYSICMRMSAHCTGDLCAIIEKILKKLWPMSQWTLDSIHICMLISFRLWNFKDGGSWKARFLAKTQYTTRKPLYLRILGVPVCQKLKFEKNVFFYKKWSPKLIFLNVFFFLKISFRFLTQKFDFESMISSLFEKP